MLYFTVPVMAQEQQYVNPTPKRDQKKKQPEEPEEVIPLYNGMYFGVDVYGLGAKLLGSDFLSTELSWSVDLKSMFMPTLEAGFGRTDTWSDTGIHYKSSAPFFRIGVDYNTKARKKERDSFLYVGLRYGFSPINYDISSLPLTDPIYGGVSNPSLEDYIWGGSVPFSHKGLKASMHWAEVVAGVKVQIYKSFYMGWALRFKYKINASTSEHGNPWYIPGFGQYKSNNLGITYSLIYRLR